MFSNLRFLGLPSPKTITTDGILEWIDSQRTKRIHFGSVHSIHLFEDGNGYLSLPFQESFEYIARKKLGHNRVLFEKDDKYARFIKKEELADFTKFIEEVRDIVFLRDRLDLSIALCLHESVSASGDIKRSDIGEHEYQLKYNPGTPESNQALQELSKLLQNRLDSLPYFRNVDYVMAIPSTRPFMVDIIKELHGFGFEDISARVAWANKKGSSKGIDDSREKLQAVDSWGFTFEPQLDLKGKSVLVLDDMYRSGVTMQYVGMKLKEAGASYVFGISICKALGNN